MGVFCLAHHHRLILHAQSRSRRAQRVSYMCYVYTLHLLSDIT